MKRDKQFLIIIMILIGLSYWQFRRNLSADETIETYQDSIKDHYRHYKLGYIRANGALKYSDSLFKTGLIINLTDCTENEIYRRMKINN